MLAFLVWVHVPLRFRCFLDELDQRAKILMAVDSDECSSLFWHFSSIRTEIPISGVNSTSGSIELAQQSDRNPPQCYYCKQPGHVQRNCLNRIRDQKGYICSRPAANCWQSGNENRMSLGGTRRP